jgi:hypothetical protein
MSLKKLSLICLLQSLLAKGGDQRFFYQCAFKVNTHKYVHEQSHTCATMFKIIVILYNKNDTE